VNLFLFWFLFGSLLNWLFFCCGGFFLCFYWCFFWLFLFLFFFEDFGFFFIEHCVNLLNVNSQVFLGFYECNEATKLKGFSKKQKTRGFNYSILPQ
jgi:hypothetical protein